MATIPSLNPVYEALNDSLLIIHDSATGTTGKIEVGSFLYAPRKISLAFESGTTFTPDLTNREQIVHCYNAAAITVTVPRSIFAAGDQIHFRQEGVGQVSFVGATDVTIEVPDETNPTTRAQGELVTIYCKVTDVVDETWCLFGGLEPL